MWYARHLPFMFYAWYGCRRFAAFSLSLSLSPFLFAPALCLHGCNRVYVLCAILSVRRKRFRFMAFIEHNFVIEANEHDRIWLSCIDRHCHNSERPNLNQPKNRLRETSSSRTFRCCVFLLFFHFERRWSILRLSYDNLSGQEIKINNSLEIVPAALSIFSVFALPLDDA